MRVLPRLWFLAIPIAILVPQARADLVFLKDGHVLRGKVRREFTAEFDRGSRDMVLIPKGFFMLDDGPRRMYFSPSRVRIVEKLYAPTEERIVSKGGRYILVRGNLPPVEEVLEVGAWDFKKWEREFYFRSPTAPRIGLMQGLNSITPYSAWVDAVTKYPWSSAYLTREWDGETVLKLLLAHPEFLESTKDDTKVKVAKRLRLSDFLAQAGWFDLAGKELDRLLKDFPDQKESVANARILLDKLRYRDECEQIKNWYQAGRYKAVAKRLEEFPTTNVPDRVQADLREMREKLATSTTRLVEAHKALDNCSKEVDTPAGRSLASAAAIIRTELHATNVDRLDAFLGQVRDAARQKARGKKPNMGPDQLLSLAVTGWLLGSPSAEARPDFAINLWKTRQMVLEYLQESDHISRKKILNDYLTTVTPRIELDEIAQLIDKLPPAQPARDLADSVIEAEAGNGRNQTPYLLKLPPEYTHNRSYPVLIVLHNAGEKARTMLARWEKLAAEHGYLLAAPDWSQGFASEYGFTEREHDAVMDTLRDLRRRYQIDSDRVFLFGLGEGGKMAFDVGLAHPDNFAGVLPMCAGPTHYPRAYWRNAQYLPFYVVNGTRAGKTQSLLREQFNNWVLRGYPALWVEYKGRGTEFFAGELPNIFDWMRHQKRAFPLRQVGTDGVGTQFGNEFGTMRPEDNRFYWLCTTGISPRNIVTPGRWSRFAQPATMTGKIDPTTNFIALKTQGLSQVSILLGRNPLGHYMIDFDKPVTVRVGFTTYVNKQRVTPSLEVLLEDLYERGDRKHLFMARIDLKLR